MNPYPHMAHELLKIAEEKKKEEEPKKRRLGFWGALGVGGKTIGGTLLGSGLGTAAGLATGALGNQIYKGVTGKSLPMNIVYPATGFLGTTTGAIMTRWLRPKMLQEARRAIEGK